MPLEQFPVLQLILFIAHIAHFENQIADVPAHARTAQDSLTQKRLEEDIF